MNACPSPEQLEQFVAGRLSEFDRSAVDSHVQTCFNCHETVRSFKRGDTGTVAVNMPADAPHLMPPPLPVELANHPRYRVVALLDVGGMGAVYKGEHRLLERPVVLKAIRPDFLGNPELVGRFLREARLAASLMHPHIVTLFEAEKIGSAQFLVMEYLEGMDLGRLVKQNGPLPVGEACEWIRQAALGLQYIHERGLVHRDIKPSNLFLTTERQVKLLDLGLAILRTESKTRKGLTEQGQILGTVDYMAPEQWEDSHAVDIRADIYSLGCTLYHLLAGDPPFARSEFFGVMNQMWAHSQAPVPPIREKRPEVSDDLAAVLDRMLAKNPSERWRTPGDVAAALEPFADVVAGTARSSPLASTVRIPGNRSTPTMVGRKTIAIRSQPKRPTRRRWIVASAAAAILLAGGLAAWHGLRSKEPDAGGPPIKVGVLHSRTGTMAISEKPVIDATLFAIDEVNADGGVLGRKVEAVVEDGASDWPTFARKAEKLLTQDKVCTVFGCWTSASRKTVKPVFEKYDHLLFYPVQYEGLEQSPNIVYTGAAPNQQIIPAIRWCCTFLKKKRLFLVGSDYIFPRAANAIIRDSAAEFGAEVVGEEYVLLGGVDTGEIIRKIQATRPDVILNTINGDSNVAFFRSLRSAGITSAQVPTISFSISEEELSNVSAKDVQGDYAAWNYFQSIDSPRNQDFVNRFRAKYGADRVLSDPMEAAYIGVHLWAQAVRAAKTDDVAAIREAIKQQSFDAPEGTVRVDPETQHTAKYIRIGRISEQNRFEVVFCSDVPMTPLPFPATRPRAAWETFLTDFQLQWGGQWANPGR